MKTVILLSLMVCLGASEADNLKAAKKFYTARCVACHGTTGKGDGAASAALKPRPRDFSSSTFWAKADDGKLKKIIIEGGAKHKMSPLMPPHKDLKPEVADQMIKVLRSFSQDSTKVKTDEKTDEKK